MGLYLPSLFAVLGVAAGTGIGQLHRRHRALEFRQFLDTIDAGSPRISTCP